MTGSGELVDASGCRLAIWRVYGIVLLCGGFLDHQRLATAYIYDKDCGRYQWPQKEAAK